MYVGLGCTDCGGTCKGMGSIDLSTMSWEDYLLLGIVGMFAIGTVFPSVFDPPKKRKRRRKKSSSVGAGFVGGLITPLILAGGGYLAYQYFSNSTSGNAFAGSVAGAQA